MASITTTPRPRPSLRNISSASTPVMRMDRQQDIRIGDPVDVPGGMDGTVRFVGEVKGKAGFFVGVELSKQWAARGKNDGDVDGVRYFSCSVPGSGIFLPITRATKRTSTALTSPISTVNTPTTPSLDSYSINEGNSMLHTTPPTPSQPPKQYNPPPGSRRAPSPAFRPKSRPSLPRPESPIRRLQNATPVGGSRPSLSSVTHNPRLGAPRFAPSPTPGKMAGRTRAMHSSMNDSPAPTSRTNGSHSNTVTPNSNRDATVSALEEENSRLEALLQEKAETITRITSEFDGHRADFRSTLDTLELASDETNRVYEAKIGELERELKMKQDQHLEVEEVALQVHHMEGLVSEMEEDLERALRGEAEARGEAEYLRGEVERLRTELRERENGVLAGKPQAQNGGNGIKEITAHEDPVTPIDGPEEDDEDFAQAMPKKNIEEPKKTVIQEDSTKWCALCEGDGHDSISCPYEKP
ncbi:hypothetical protein MMC25_004632 [Agyrium rufum]|nr:hypothetical protein [Agyrium rufum]